MQIPCDGGKATVTGAYLCCCVGINIDMLLLLLLPP